MAVTQAGKGALLDAHPSCLGAHRRHRHRGRQRRRARSGPRDLPRHAAVRFHDRVEDAVSEPARALHRRQRPLRRRPQARRAAARRRRARHPAAAHALRSPAGAFRRAIAPASQRARDGVGRDARRRSSRPKRGVALTQAQVIDEVNRACGADGTMVHAAGGLPGDIHKLWRRTPRTTTTRSTATPAWATRSPARSA